MLGFLKNKKEAEKIIITEAKAWLIKYLILVSEDRGFILLIIKGTNLIRLISKPSQHENHEDDEIAIIVPNKRADK